MSNYSSNLDRLAGSPDSLIQRVTNRPCTYVKHRGEPEERPHAVLMVELNNHCCSKPENASYDLCWRCAIGAMDGFRCRCRSEDSEHSMDDLTYKGDIVPATV